MGLGELRLGDRECRLWRKFRYAFQVAADGTVLEPSGDRRDDVAVNS